MSARFVRTDAPLPGLIVLRRNPIGDSRGRLERLFCSEELEAVVDGRSIVQINRTLTVRRGTVRGLHFQRPPYAEMKFVSCLRGAVFDVAVDLRKGSATLLRWHSEVLTADDHKTFVIPEGFAHGFQTLADDTELLYFHTAAYHAEAEDAVSARDPRIAIAWPEPITEMSARDGSHPMLREDFRGLAL